MDNGAVGSTHDSFRLAVAVPVIGYDVLLIILEVTHVRTAVDPPKARTVLLQTLEDAVLFGLYASNGRTIFGIILLHLLQVVKLHQNLQFAVSIDIGAAGIIGNKGALDVLVLKNDFLVCVCPWLLCRTGRLLLHTTHNRLDGIAV